MGLTDKVIVFLGNTRFDSPIKATSLFIAQNLAINNKVFFVDYPFTLKDYYTYNNSEELKTRRKKFALSSDGLIDTDQPNFKIVITPPVLPINFLPEGMMFRTMLRLNESFIVARLKKLFKQQGITDFIYINSFNFHYPNIARKLKPTLKVYQCVDPMIVPYDMKHGISSEDQLVKESDLVICTSKALFNQKKLQNPNTYFVPNASEVAHFTRALDEELPVHEKLKDIPGPIVGYLGTIERRIDYDLVSKVAMDNPHKSFVFAGPIWHDQLPKSFTEQPNVHILGPIPYAEIPQLVKGYDVAIIPFKKDEVSSTIFPLKLFEYLGAGRAVVVTDFNPDLKDYTADVVSYAVNADEFTTAINDGLTTNSAEKVAKRVAVARLNTWEKRTDDIGDIISSHL